jgi:hypothetical protein
MITFSFIDNEPFSHWSFSKNTGVPMYKLGYLFVIAASVNIALHLNSKAFSSSDPPKKEEAPAPRKKVESSGFTGAKMHYGMRSNSKFIRLAGKKRLFR